MRKISLSFEAALELVRDLSEHRRTRDPEAPRVAAGPWRPFAVKPARFGSSAAQRQQNQFALMVVDARRADSFRQGVKVWDPELLKRAEDLHMTPREYVAWQRQRADAGYLQPVKERR